MSNSALFNLNYNNRYYLEYKVKELILKNIEFKLYYLDLNKFKPINDNYGHDVGDIVLSKTVAKLNSIEYFKNLVFRVGGDEFVLLQTLNIKKDLTDVIYKKIEEPIKYKKLEFKISTSIGIALSKQHKSLDLMLKHADEMMFKNKNN